jgi:hypothetical protein
MWFGYSEENTWYPLNVDRVNQILALNREGKKPVSLEEDVAAEKVPVQTLNSDLERMDQKFRDKTKRKKKKKRGRDNRNPNQNQNPNRNQNRQNRNPNQPPNQG